MFQKLISNLPFCPSLIDEVALYSKQLKRESRIRGYGLVLITAAVVFQLLGSIFITGPVTRNTTGKSGNNVLGASTHTPTDKYQQNAVSKTTQSHENNAFAIIRSVPQIARSHVLAAGLSVIGLAAYFLARDRLLSKELDLVKSDITSGGM